MWSNGDILVSDDYTLLQYIGKGIDDDTFSGVVLESDYWKKGKISSGWCIGAFTLATQENIPKKWHKYLINKNKEYSIRSSEKYKYSEEFLSKKFKIIEDRGGVCLIELINTKIVIRTIIPKFDIEELNYTIRGEEYSYILSNFLKEENK